MASWSGARVLFADIGAIRGNGSAVANPGGLMQQNGKVAIITGGARGFGRAFAERFVGEGVAVAILDRDRDTAEAVARCLTDAGGTAIAIPCDVADEMTVKDSIARVEVTLGGVDILINNAGLLTANYSKDFIESTNAELRAVLEVNVIGVVNCTVAARDSMVRRGGGTIVNLSSIAGYSIAGPYGLSKLAVRGLTLAFARELAPDGIRVNAVAPGLMATETVMADLPAEMVRHFREDLQLIKRPGLPEDIVDAVMFLCSDRASFVTGETLRVSGGFPLEV